MNSIPSATLASGLIGANSGTAVMSNGAATDTIEATGSDGCAAEVSSEKIPPRHHATMCTGCPPASSLTDRMARGSTSSTQCSTPRLRSENATVP